MRDEVKKELMEFLEDVIEKRGPFALEPLQHAHNILEDFSERAKKLKDRIDPPTLDELIKCRTHSDIQQCSMAGNCCYDEKCEDH